MSADCGVNLKVIGVGLSRTGTLSMRSALEMLVGRCYHGAIPSVEKKWHQAFWNKCMEKGELDTSNYQEVLGGYKAGVDMPFIIWWKDLIRLHPSAKVILTVRDPLKWRQSWNNSIEKYFEMATSFPGNWMHKILGERPSVEFMINTRNTMRVESLNMTMQNAVLGDETAIKFFQEHIEEVKSHVPPENLLIFEVKDGWGPLCNFLQVQEPDGPFPRINDTNDILYLRNVALVLSWLVVVGLPSLLAFYAFFFAKDIYQIMFIIMGSVLVLICTREVFHRVTKTHSEQAKKID